MGLTERFDGFQQAHPWLGFPLAVVYKFVDDQGGYLAALITYYGFLSLFPLLLLLVTSLGFLLHGNTELQARVLTSALSEFPILGDAIRTNVASLHGSGVAVVVGVLGSLYGGIGVGQAGQNAMNTLWRVPRDRRPSVLGGWARSLVAVLLLGSGVLTTTILSGLFESGGAFAAGLGPVGMLLTVLISVAGNSVLFLVGFHYLPSRPLSYRQLLPGAVVAAVTWQLLVRVGAYYLDHSLRHASQVYGLFGIVLGLLGWLYVGAMLTILGAEINVVRSERLWPRALLTHFTDDVDLTDADERSFAATAGAQRLKGFQKIDVTFDKGPAPP